VEEEEVEEEVEVVVVVVVVENSRSKDKDKENRAGRDEGEMIQSLAGRGTQGEGVKEGKRHKREIIATDKPPNQKGMSG
jgi:hypothetical protein